jgi:O-antigen ligase
MDKININRSLIIFIIAIICFIGSVVTGLATIEQRNFYLRGYVNPTQTLDLPYRIPRLGVNADLSQYSLDELPNHFDRMQEIGITWIRQFFDDNADLQQWDDILSLLDEYPQLELIPVLVGSTLDIDAFSSFVSEFANRYADTITYYQIWDEPNIQIGWLDNQPNPTHYIALLQSAYTTIHQIDPQAHIISAALAPTIETGPQNISDHIFLRQLYQLGLKNYSDSIAGKPYGFDTSPNERSITHEQINFSRFIVLREIMEEYGDGQKALWASNWGWNSLTDDWQGQHSIWGQVSLEQQAQYTIDALNRAETEWAWLGGLVLDNWQADKQFLDNPLWGFSLLTPQDEPRPIYHALEQYHQNQPNVAVNGLYPANNPYTEYSGVWTFHELGADIGWVQDSQITFNFYGNAVSLITRQDDYVTNLYVTVDGAPANQLPADLNGNAYLLLKSSRLIPEIVNQPLGNNLSTSNHQLQIVADELIPDEDIPRWSIVGYGVSYHDLEKPYNHQITASVIASVFAFVAVIISGIYVDFARYFAPVSQLWRRLNDWAHILVALFASIVVMLSMLITWHDGYPQFFRRESIQALLGIATAGLIYWNGFQLPIALILMCFLVLIIYNNLKIGVLLIIFWMPFFLFPVELYRYAFPMVEVMLILTFVAWLARLTVNSAKTHRLPSPKFHLVDGVVIAWILTGVLGLMMAEIRGVAITDFRTLYLQPALFYLVARTIKQDTRFLHQMVITFIVSAVIVSLIGLYQLLTGVFIQAEGGSMRLASVYGSPNNAALFLERSLPLIISFLLLGKYDRWLKVALAICGLVITIALVLTLSAGALFIAIPACIVGVLVLIYGKKSFKYLLPFGIIFCIAFVVALQFPRFERLVDLTSGTNFYRVRVWQSALNMIEDYPLTGIGLDQFLYKYRGEYILPDAWQEPELSHPHNVVLDFWLRSGVIGITFLIFAIATISRIIQQSLSMDNKQYFVIIVGCAGSFITLFTHGLVDNSIFVIDLAYIFVLLLVILTFINSNHITTQQGELL